MNYQVSIRDLLHWKIRFLGKKVRLASMGYGVVMQSGDKNKDKKEIRA